ncbi:hypothetical protein KCTC52924_03923 [Arenibacter antarcticus]|uniref:Lipoprotein n=1 Tax=Arenibacter antarcticus TaxID=2040469 RepID=A0ABW5VF67_9FLAO|nr:hypothetical protein [Arenibacter sp. H213]MCM4169725.1 hypothetical protein [Arenibacter sp. H213]
MKRIILAPIVMLIIISCSGVKKTQEDINLGNYDIAINNALKNIAENKSKKSNQPYIHLLEEAFKKNTERELQHIAFLKKDNNPSNLEAIYNGYQKLKSKQERIRPLLPLQLFDENRQAKFAFKDYDEDIIRAKDRFSDFLHKNATTLLQTGINKQDFRKSYEDFTYLNQINPDFKDVKLKAEEAYNKGLDYVNVVLINDSDQIIPARLEEELLNFNTYGLNDKWTVYHSNTRQDLQYDYQMEVAFKQINISPEQLTEKQIQKEKQIKDGYKYAVNANGQVLKDSLGNKIKVDKFKTIQSNFYEFTQFKMVQLTGNISFIDLHTHQQLNAYPLMSEFVFRHIYAKYDGDKRALEDELLPFLKQVSVPFPTSEQMVYDAGEDLKHKLKGILNRHRFN